MTHDSAGTHLSLKVRSGAIGHVAALEPSSVGRRSPESPPQAGGEVRSREARSSAGAHLNREARSGALEHVTASEPTSTERRGPKPQNI
jgi:hypothetical protein